MIDKKEKHSKLKDIKYKHLEMQNYLKSNNNLTDEEKCLLFRFRVREINVKCNYKNKYLDLKCDFCKNDFDDNPPVYESCYWEINY